jgi:hypothetical protein
MCLITGDNIMFFHRATGIQGRPSSELSENEKHRENECTESNVASNTAVLVCLAMSDRMYVRIDKY